MAISTATIPGQILTSAYVNNNINSGLTYISTITLSAGSGTALQWSGTVFSSTYTNYRLMCNLIKTGGGDAVNMTLGIGTTATSADYYGGGMGVASSGAAAVTAFNQSNTALFTRAFGNISTVAGCVMDIYNPNAATNTGITSISTGGNGDGDGNTTNFSGWQGSNTQFTSFAINPAAGTLAGTIQVYGYRIA